jgi:hypothetical protein
MKYFSMMAIIMNHCNNRCCNHIYCWSCAHVWAQYCKEHESKSYCNSNFATGHRGVVSVMLLSFYSQGRYYCTHSLIWFMNSRAGMDIGKRKSFRLSQKLKSLLSNLQLDTLQTWLWWHLNPQSVNLQNLGIHPLIVSVLTQDLCLYCRLILMQYV